jgi:hypothetical protein
MSYALPPLASKAATMGQKRSSNFRSYFTILISSVALMQQKLRFRKQRPTTNCGRSRPSVAFPAIYNIELLITGTNRGCPKPRRDAEPGQSSAEIIGERRQRTAMDMAAVVEMTVIDIEFAD